MESGVGIPRGGTTDLYSRNEKVLFKYPELVEVFRNQKAASFIVDGEVAAFEDGPSSFAKLQQRMQVRQPSAELRKRVPVCFCAFDLLFLGTHDLRQLSLRNRKELLEAVLEFKEPLRFTEHRETEGEAYYRACGDDGKVSSPEQRVRIRGRDNGSNSNASTSRSLIAGYTDPKANRLASALLVGYYERGS